MRQAVLILPEGGRKLPTINELQAKGFAISSAVFTNNSIRSLPEENPMEGIDTIIPALCQKEEPERIDKSEF